MQGFKLLMALLLLLGLGVENGRAQTCPEYPKPTATYTPMGKIIKVGDMEVYETMGSPTATKTLIDVYDILGFTDNTKQVADMVAKRGNFRVAVPDFYRGKSPFNPSNFPPADRSEIGKFLGQHGDWNKTAKPDMLATMKHYRDAGYKGDFGMFGFCWGGRIGVTASKEIPELKAVAIVHPANVQNEEANDVKAPFLLLPSVNEPDMIPFLEILQKRWPNSVAHKKFTLFHGFSGGMGKFDNPKNAEEVAEVVTMIAAFMDVLLN